MNCGQSSSGKGKRPVINENEELIVSSDEENTIPNNNKKIKLSKTPKNTKPFSEIWEYYEKGAQKNNGHYEAICFYCKTKWSRGKPQKMEVHLANECIQCPEEISIYWRENIANRQTTYSRNNQKLLSSQPPYSTQTQITDHYKSDQSLPKFVVDRLDKKILKAWVMAGIPFNVIENPFVLDLFKDLNPGYSPPSRTTLSDRLITEEYTRVNLAIERDLEQSDNLTLALDGWTTPKMKSIYNYIVTTDTRMEYLIGLYDYSSDSHTSEFLTEEISSIIEKLGSDKFAAIVTDNASNCRVARQNIHQTYPHIWNIRCAAHAINLIASDLVKLEPIKKFINECGKINRYFSTSHASNALLRQGFTTMKIKGGGLQTWVKTRWGSLFMTMDALLRARPVFDWILREHANSITNNEVAALMEDESFFSICRSVRSIWKPIKECINLLEANEATLSDCFIHLIKLANAIHRLPITNVFKSFSINIFNYRFEEFLHPLYILAYYLHPYYRGKGLKDEAFHKAALAAIEMWQSLGHTRKESEELIAQLRRFELKLAPFDLPYISGLESPNVWWKLIKIQPRHLPELACQIFSINPTQANCERNFSTLNWILGDRRTNLTLKKLEAIAKIRSYYMNNIQKELSYMSKDLTESELRESTNIASVNSIISLEEDDDTVNIDGDNNLNHTSPSENFSNTELAISNIVDLTAVDDTNGEMSSDITPVQEQPLDPADLDYDPNDVLNGFIGCERDTERNLTDSGKS
ncbi:ribonuclease H-like domain-containing protein [Rhizophagus irregularis DAOM 181602=DAOM 197198]|nr:ribonuclease H-like domain-containing protein [Rhizophagus irregularis DAOM 181602=DAOM 197198]CAG8755942.1 489_t:CDS:2 [Rhizophagus irregularis]